MQPLPCAAAGNGAKGPGCKQSPRRYARGPGQPDVGVPGEMGIVRQAFSNGARPLRFPRREGSAPRCRSTKTQPNSANVASGRCGRVKGKPRLTRGLGARVLCTAPRRGFPHRSHRASGRYEFGPFRARRLHTRLRFRRPCLSRPEGGARKCRRPLRSRVPRTPTFPPVACRASPRWAIRTPSKTTNTPVPSDDRSLVTVSALVATGQVAQVPYHPNRAMDNGLTKEQADEALTPLPSMSAGRMHFRRCRCLRTCREASAMIEEQQARKAMPHVIETLARKTEQQKQDLPDKITRAVMDTLHYGEESVSVGFEEVPATGWRRCTNPTSEPAKAS